MNILNKIYLKNFIIYILYNILLLAIAYVFNRFYQMLLFVLIYNFIQNCFTERFHSDSVIDEPIRATRWCKIITIIVEFIYLIFCKNLNISIYSNLFIIFVICLLNSLIQIFLKYIERTRPPQRYLSKGISVNELNEICEEHNIVGIEKDILDMYYVKRFKLTKIARILDYSVDGIKKIKYKTLKRINES